MRVSKVAHLEEAVGDLFSENSEVDRDGFVSILRGKLRLVYSESMSSLPLHPIE